MTVEECDALAEEEPVEKSVCGLKKSNNCIDEDFLVVFNCSCIVFFSYSFKINEAPILSAYPFVYGIVVFIKYKSIVFISFLNLIAKSEPSSCVCVKNCICYREILFEVCKEICDKPDNHIKNIVGVYIVINKHCINEFCK